MSLRPAGRFIFFIVFGVFLQDGGLMKIIRLLFLQDVEQHSEVKPFEGSTVKFFQRTDSRQKSKNITKQKKLSSNTNIKAFAPVILSGAIRHVSQQGKMLSDHAECGFGHQHFILARRR